MLTYDVAVVGAGVIGMSIAWELAEHGQRVLLLDRPRGRNSASWAAAGMLPPMGDAAQDPLDQLQAYSHIIYPEWVSRLQESSGVDVEYWPCGSWHVATAVGESAALAASSAHWEEDGVRFETAPVADLPRREPTLAAAVRTGVIQAAYFLPDQRQVQPRLVLSALREALHRRGVAVATPVPEHGRLQLDARHGWHISASDHSFQAKQVCLAAGAYTIEILRKWELSIDLEPRRGQMIQLAASESRPSVIIEQGPRYIVPRRDGRILVGSTVEDVGFRDDTRQEDLQRLHKFAAGLIPELRDVPVESTWAGLRPRMGSGYPLLCPVPGRPHAWLATGHFRHGIQLAPATAVLMRQLILQQAPAVDPQAFQLR